MKLLIISLAFFLSSQTSDIFALEDIFASFHRKASPSPSVSPSVSPSPESFQKGKASISSSASAEGSGSTASATATTTGEVASGKKPKKHQKKVMSTKGQTLFLFFLTICVGFLGSKSAKQARKKARKTHKKMSAGKTPKNATLSETTVTKSSGAHEKTDQKTMESWLSQFVDDDDDDDFAVEGEGEV